MKLGRIQWAGIGIVTLLLVVMAPSDKEASDHKAAHFGNQNSSDSSGLSPAGKQHTHVPGHVELELLAKLEQQNKIKKNVGDAFNTDSWDEPAVSTLRVPVQVVAPPPPVVVVQTAPPLPFTYLGRYGDTPERIIVLSRGDRVYTVAVGDVIDNTYRVEKFTKGMVNLTYLPLSIEQHLPTGEAL